MILYHYTTELHLPKIFADEQLNPTESNLSGWSSHAGPDVVWLTSWSSPDDGTALGLTGGVDKTAVRFTVDVPRLEVDQWDSWAKRHGIAREWKRALKNAARIPEGERAPWLVIERPIGMDEWVEVTHMRKGVVLWNA